MQFRRYYQIISMILCMQCMAACTPPPPVNNSREILWQQFGHKSIDTLLMGWGAPAGETRLTNGSRMVSYHHSTTYDSGGSAGCEVTFLAPPPAYHIEDISMTGSASECARLAQGQRGDRHINDLPPPQPGLYAPYYHYPF